MHSPEKISFVSAVEIMNYFLKFLGEHCNNLITLEFLPTTEPFIATLVLHIKGLRHTVLLYLIVWWVGGGMESDLMYMTVTL